MNIEIRSFNNSFLEIKINIEGINVTETIYTNKEKIELASHLAIIISELLDYEIVEPTKG